MHLVSLKLGSVGSNVAKCVTRIKSNRILRKWEEPNHLESSWWCDWHPVHTSKERNSQQTQNNGLNIIKKIDYEKLFHLVHLRFSWGYSSYLICIKYIIIWLTIPECNQCLNIWTRFYANGLLLEVMIEAAILNLSNWTLKEIKPRRNMCNIKKKNLYTNLTQNHILQYSIMDTMFHFSLAP